MRPIHRLALATVAAYVLAGITSNSTASIRFDAPYVFSDAPNLTGVAIGDVSGDAIPDAVCSRSGSSGLPDSLRVLLGDGQGQFVSPRTLHLTGEAAQAPVLVDLNSDGLRDIIVLAASGTNRIVSVFLSLGGGNFGPRMDSNSGSHAAIATGDFNDDLRADLALQQFNSQVLVALGNGNGTFGAPQLFGTATTGNFQRGFAVGDIDGDGHLDFMSVFASCCNLQILYGDGNGGFLAPSIAAFSAPRPVLGDVTGDGRDDLVGIVNSTSLHVILGCADRSLQPPVTQTITESGAIALADFDGDGRQDAMLLSFDLLYARSLGNGTFATPQARPDIESPVQIVAGNSDGSGPPDVVLLSNSGIAVYRGNGNGTFGTKVHVINHSDASDMDVADLDQDSKIDVVVSRSNLGALNVLEGNGDGTFTTAPDIIAGQDATAVAATDLQPDGFVDLAVIDRSIDVVRILNGTGGGTFTSAGIYAAAGGPVKIAGRDLIGDLRPDLVVLNQTSGSVSVFPGTASGFGHKQDAVVPGPVDLAFGNLLGSTSSDLVVASTTGNAVAIFENLGTGLGPREDYGAGASPLSVAVADLNHDGEDDVIVGGIGSLLSIFDGMSDGSLAPRRTIALRSFYADDFNDLVATDLDDDGNVDVVVLRKRTATACVLRGDGMGDLIPTVNLGLSSGPIALRAGDVTGDGRVDLLALMEYQGSTFVVPLINRSTATAATGVHSTSPRTLSIDRVRLDAAGLWLTATLPRADRAEISLLDVTGRRIASTSIVLGSGSHSVHHGVTLRAGVYFARITQGGAADVRKAVFLPQ